MSSAEPDAPYDMVKRYEEPVTVGELWHILNALMPTLENVAIVIDDCQSFTHHIWSIEVPMRGGKHIHRVVLTTGDDAGVQP